MPSSSNNALSSSLLSRQMARACRPRPWLTHSTASSSSATYPPVTAAARAKLDNNPSMPKPAPIRSQPIRTVFIKPQQPAPMPDAHSTSASSLISRAIARASRLRPWLAQSSKPMPAAVKLTPTADWAQSQAIDRQAADHQHLPLERLTTWLKTQAISPPPSKIPLPKPVSSVWGRKSSAYYERQVSQLSKNELPPRLTFWGTRSRIAFRQAFARFTSPSPPRPPAASTWGRKSRRLGLRQALTRLASPSPPRQALPPITMSPFPDSAFALSPTTAALASNVLERYDPRPLRVQLHRFDKVLNATRLAYFKLCQTLDDQASSDDDPTPPPRKPLVSFSNSPPQVHIVSRWIGVDRPKGEHVSADPTRWMGHLRSWTSIKEDPTSYHTTWSSEIDNSSFDHTGCRNPGCHFVAKDLWKWNGLIEW